MNNSDSRVSITGENQITVENVSRRDQGIFVCNSQLGRFIMRAIGLLLVRGEEL